MNEQIIKFYKTHTGAKTRKQFNISQGKLEKILDENNIQRHTKKESQELAQLAGDYKAPPSTSGKHHYNDGVNNIICTEEEAKEKCYNEGFLPMPKDIKIRKQALYEETNTKKYGDAHYNNREKSAKTTFEHYGVRNIAQSVEYHKEASKKYIYDNLSFDSSWELALYIYATDHDEQIERAPISLVYYVDHKQHRYIPDFRYNGELIEIKGDNFINSDGELVDYKTKISTDKTRAKQKCMVENNVKLVLRKDVKQYIDYVKSTYGKNYLKSFKI